MTWKNTGLMRIRETWIRRLIVLQVQQRDDFYKHQLRWHDASLSDLQEIPYSEAVLPAIQSLRLVK